MKDLLVQRIEADRDALESVRLESRGLLREQYPVGREREILDAVDSGQLTHEIREPGAQQRLTTREPQFRHAEPGSQPRDPRDFLEGEALGRL